MSERELIRLLGQDLSAGTAAFRDALLARCLQVLASQEDELDEADLEMLSAAGDPTTLPPTSA